MNIDNPTAYIFFDKERDWECALTINRKEYDGYDGWYLGGIVHSIKEIFTLLEDHGFDSEYIYLFLDDIPHWIYNARNK